MLHLNKLPGPLSGGQTKACKVFGYPKSIRADNVLCAEPNMIMRQKAFYPQNASAA